jgi:hypothetical protein
MFEELNCKGEAYQPTRHPRIMRFVTVAEDRDKMTEILQALGRELHQAGPDRLKQLIQHHLPEYTPDLGATAEPVPHKATSKPPVKHAAKDAELVSAKR